MLRVSTSGAKEAPDTDPKEIWFKAHHAMNTYHDFVSQSFTASHPAPHTRFAPTLTAVLLFLSAVAKAYAGDCPLHPIALSLVPLKDVSPGEILPDALNGQQPGQFGWLSWSGSPNTPTLLHSLTLPDAHLDYVNPDNPADHRLDLGDWVSAKPGLSNAKDVRSALTHLLNTEITVPVWDTTRDQGEKTAYQIAAFARIELLDFDLPGQNRIRARFLGLAPCSTVNTAPAVDAGPDLNLPPGTPAILSATVSDDGLPAGVLTFEWSQVDGPANAVFTSPDTLQTTVSFPVGGSYTLQLGADDGELVGRDTLRITVGIPNQIPTANAQSFNTPEDSTVSIRLTGGDPEGQPLSFHVTRSPNHGRLTGTPPNLNYEPDPDYNGPDAFLFEVHDGELSSEPAEITLSILPVNDPPTADDLTAYTLEDEALSLQLSGADIEGTPLDFTLLSPPTHGDLFLDPVIPGRAVYQPHLDTYGPDQAWFCVSDGALSSAPASIQIEVLPVNDPPLPEAGPDQVATRDEPFALQGTVQDDNPPTDPLLTTVWSKLSGPGPVHFDDPFALATLAKADVAGVYILQLTAYDSLLAGSDSLRLTVCSSDENQSPTVEAGPDQVIGLARYALLDGQASDDAFPGTPALSVTWSLVNGPGETTFDDPHALSTTARFSTDGTYVLQLQASDGSFTAQDHVTIRLQTDNLPPRVDAGPDRSFSLTDSVSDWIRAGQARVGRIMVANDEWPLSDQGFLNAPAAGTLARNVAAWFTHGRGGRFLAHTRNFGLSGRSLAVTLRAAGHSWTLDPNLPFTLDNLLSYDAVWLANSPVNLDVLTDYVHAGGSVFIASGTGGGLPGGEVQFWNGFLRPFGLELDPAYHGVNATVPIEGDHPIVREVDALYLYNGNYVRPTNPDNPATRIVAGTPDAGLLGIVDPAQTPLVLQGTVVNDPQTTPSQLVFLWEQIAGPATASLGSSASPTTSVSFPEPGTYTFRLTASDSIQSGHDDVTITVTRHDPPSVEVGPDRTLTLPEPLPCHGSGTDPNTPAEELHFRWETVAGPAPVTFADPLVAETIATFTEPGRYVLQFSAATETYVSTDLQTVDVHLPTLPLAPGLAAWFAFDDSLLDHIATLGAEVSGAAAFVPGLSQNALLLDGQTTGVRLPSHPALNPGQPPHPGLTLEAWIAPEGAAASRPLLVWQDTTGQIGLEWWLHRSSPGALSANLIDTSGTPHLIATPPNLHPADPRYVQNGRFQHVALTYDSVSGETVLYLDAHAVARQHFGTFQPRTDLDAWIGYHPASGTRYQGRIDEVAIHHRALHPDEITQITQAGPNGRDKSLRLDAGPELTTEPHLPLDLHVTCSGGSVALGELPSLAWSLNEGPGDATFNDSTSPHPTARFSAPGTYHLQITATTLSTSAVASLNVHVLPPGSLNLPPTVDAGPDTTTFQHLTFQPQAHVDDDHVPAGQSLQLQWQIVEAPAPVAFDDPTASQPHIRFTAPGRHIFRLSASDSVLNASDEITVTVLRNNPPSVDAGPNLITPEPAVSLSGTVTDDGLPEPNLITAWTLVRGPGEARFTAPQSLSTSLSLTVPGAYLLRLTADDGAHRSSDECIIDFSPPPNLPPLVDAGPDRTVALEEPTLLAAHVSDDAQPTATLQSSWEQLSGPAPIHLVRVNQQDLVSFDLPGSYTLQLRASDGVLESVDSVTLTVVPKPEPPQVELATPSEDQSITTLTPLHGTVSSPFLQSWELQLRRKPRADNPPWQTLTGDTAERLHTTLGVFDPTSLPNGLYELRLVAGDELGQTTATETLTVALSGAYKPGRFQIAFQDLTLPSPGFPLSLVRTYDTAAAQQTRSGDFGFGWTLQIHGVRLEKSTHLGRAWQAVHSGGWYALNPAQPHLITVTLPDDQVLRFAPVLTPSLQFGYPIASVSMSFTNLSGSRATLEIDGHARADLDGFLGPVNLIGDTGLDLFNPTRFRLTTSDGTTLNLDANTGLQSITDLNGNTLTVTPQGLLHSSGQSVTFARDPQGRISTITDPVGRRFHYVYDALNHLVRFDPPDGQSHRFTYDNKHRLVDLIDPRGISLLRNHYDSAGRLVAQSDAAGHALTLEHELPARREILRDRLGNVTVQDCDERGNIVRTQDPLGAVTTYAYDEHDRLLETVNPLGHSVTHTYDTSGNRLSTTDALGHTTRFTHDDQNRVTQVTDPLGRIQRFTYNARGQLHTQTDPAGALTGFAYDDQGLLVALTNALGHVTRFTRDAHGALTSRTDALDHTTTFDLDALGNVLEQHLTLTHLGTPVTLTSRFSYDTRDRLIAATAPDGATLAIDYNTLGHPASLTDPLHRTTSLDYDTLGRPTRFTHPDGSSRSVAYDAEGRCIALTNELGNVTRWTRDALGRIVATQHPDASLESRSFDLAGRLVSTTDARGNITLLGYDPANRLVSITNPLGQVTSARYDAAGQLVSVTDPAGTTTTFHYDQRGCLIQTRYADGSSTHTDYNAVGQPRQYTDADGHITAYAYDALGRLVAVTNALGQITRYTYDERGSLVAQTDANHHTTCYAYDAAGRLTQRLLPSGASESFTYDQAGRLARHTDFNGATTTFTHDDRDRLVQRTPDPTFAEPPIRMTYDALGRRTTLEDACGRSAYTYDLRNRLLELNRQHYPLGNTPPWTSRLTYAYDTSGNLTDTQSGQVNGPSIRYHYDALNRLASVQDTHLGETLYTYDASGQLTETLRPNGLHTLRQYDPLGRPANLLTSDPQGVLASYRYERTPNGSQIAASESLFIPVGWHQLTRSYLYDDTGHLLRETLQTDNPLSTGVLEYTYDAVGNRLSRHSNLPALPAIDSTYDDADQLTQDLYDANGNTVLGTTTSGTSPSCVYDSANRLKRTTLSDGTTIEFRHNGDGHLEARTLTRPGATPQTTWFLTDLLNPTGWPQVLEELQNLDPTSSEPVVTRAFTWGHELIAQDQLLDNAWSESWFGSDGHRNIRFLVGPGGAVSDYYDYDAFGRHLVVSGHTPNRYGFAGESWDSGLKLYHLRARYLNPDTGRFWTRDPFPGLVGQPETHHPYLYCAADPVNAWDPSGCYTLAEAKVTTAIASIIHGMAVFHGTDTLLQGQEELSAVGLAGPELYDAIELVLLYQLVSDSAAIFNVSRAAPALTRFASAKAASALGKLGQLTPRQWLNLKLSSPTPLARQAAQAEKIATGEAVATRGVFFFGEDVFPYLDRSQATLGQTGRPHFFAPLEDTSMIRTIGDAARQTGQAPSITRAYVTGGRGFGVSFPTSGSSMRLPIRGDAAGNPNFLPGGRTAVALPGQNSGYLLNSTREFVIDGGGRMPEGSVLFELLSNGAWMPIRRF